MLGTSLERVPEDLFRKIRYAAIRNRRSMDEEILARLEASFPATPDRVEALVERIRRQRESRGEIDCDEETIQKMKEAGRP